MNWLNAFSEGSVAAFACARSSLASAALRLALWICVPYWRARARASCSVIVSGVCGVCATAEDRQREYRDKAETRQGGHACVQWIIAG